MPRARSFIFISHIESPCHQIRISIHISWSRIRTSVCYNQEIRAPVLCDREREHPRTVVQSHQWNSWTAGNPNLPFVSFLSASWDYPILWFCRVPFPLFGMISALSNISWAGTWRVLSSDEPHQLDFTVPDLRSLLPHLGPPRQNGPCTFLRNRPHNSFHLEAAESNIQLTNP